jgi:hypothetical protein
VSTTAAVGERVQAVRDEAFELGLVPGVEEVGVTGVLAAGGESEAFASADRIAECEGDRWHLDRVG